MGAPGVGPGRVAGRGRRRRPSPRRCGDHPGARVGFRPAAGSDLARALGLARRRRDRPWSSAVDALRVVADDRELFAVNMVVVGVAPDRTGRFDPRPGGPGPGRRPGRPRRARHRRRGRQRPVPARRRRRAAGPPRRRPGRGPGVRARARRAGGRARPAAPGRPPAPPRHHPVQRAATSRSRADRGPVPLEVDGVAVPPAALVTVDVVPGRLRAACSERIPAAETAKSTGGRRRRRYHRQPWPVASTLEARLWACTPRSTSPPTRRPSSGRTSRTSTVRCSRSSTCPRS